jgi:hypothetical protein
MCVLSLGEIGLVSDELNRGNRQKASITDRNPRPVGHLSVKCIVIARQSIFVPEDKSAKQRAGDFEESPRGA